MASFAAFSAAARRRAMPMVIQKTQKRGMALGGHSGPPPDWQGVDKVVRGYFPYDYQLAIAILSGYAGLTVLYKIKSALTRKPAPEPEPVKVVEAPATTGVPSIESAAFEKFVESEAFAKLLESEDQLKSLVESA